MTAITDRNVTKTPAGASQYAPVGQAALNSATPASGRVSASRRFAVVTSRSRPSSSIVGNAVIGHLPGV